MNVGIYLDLRNPLAWRREWSRVYAFGLELCEEAEGLGAHSVWLSEHHLFDDGYLPQPLTFAAAVAARTRRMRIGTAVLLAPLRVATEIAEDAAIVDAISGGRLDLGLGAGYRLPEFEAYRVDRARRYAATEDRVRALRALWRESRVLPRPVQDPLPIWLGYGGPQGARRAGVLGVGLLSARPELYESYRAGLVEAGHDPASARMAGVVPAFVTDDPERDWPVVARHHAYQWDSYRRHMVEGTGLPVPRPIDPQLSRARGLGGGLGNLLYGTPEDAAHAITDHLSGTPIETIFLWASLGGMGEDMTLRHVETICRRLAPLLADA